MDQQRRARLRGKNAIIAWLVEPAVDIHVDDRPILHASLLSAPDAVVTGALAGLSITVAAALRTGGEQFWILVVAELLVLSQRLLAIRDFRRDFRAGRLPAIDRPVALSILWSLLQGLSALCVTLTGDMVLIVISTAFVLGLIAPICARNYAAPRLAVLLVVVSDLPFKAGLAMSGHALLWMLVPISLPLFFGLRTMLRGFGNILAVSLNIARQNHFLAGHDALTGLVNRHGLDQYLDELSSSTDARFTLFCIDLDRFKPVNDRYGHAAGDIVLIEVANRMRETARDAAVIARLGGDEFLIVVHGMNATDAASFACRITASVSDRGYRVDGTGRIGIGASVGYASFPEDAPTIPALRVRADDALYAAKRGAGISRHGDTVTAINAA